MVSGHGSWQRLGTATPSWITEQVCWDGTGMRLSQKKWSQWSQRYTGTPWKVKPEAECNPEVKVLKPADGEQSFKFEKTWNTNCLQVWQMKRKKECPTNKKYVSLMGRESFWMQNCRNRNEIFLYSYYDAFLICTSDPGLDFPSCGTSNGDQLPFKMSFCVQGINCSINLKA